MNTIKINNAHLHNLKNIDISIPKNKLITATGISGSGKTTLFFDIIFEEGRKRYLESLGMINPITDNNHFDEINGIGPTIAIKQKIIRQSNPRSVVGTRINALNYLHLLFSYEGKKKCTNCGELLDFNSAQIEHNSLMYGRQGLNPDYICENCGNNEERLESSFFSFNSFQGMCLTCKGRGFVSDLNWDTIIPNKSTTLQQVLKNTELLKLKTFQRKVLECQKQYDFSINTPFSELPTEVQNILLYGIYPDRPEKSNLNIVHVVKRRHSRLQKGIDLVSVKKCPKCDGFRIGEDTRKTLINQKHIGQIGLMTIADLNEFLNDCKKIKFTTIGLNLLRKIQANVDSLINIGLSYLTLYRELPSLSAGEKQRLSLMKHLDSKINSVSYIFDEPTMGLHEIEKNNIITKIRKLKNLGNSVFLIEHDKNFISKSDEIIDFGPLAGTNGGEIVYQGNYEGLLKEPISITGKYLTGSMKLPNKTIDEYVKITETTPKLKIFHANKHNLKNLNVEIPLYAIIGICGVSGSGKSSLISDTLIPLLRNYFHMRKSTNEKENKKINKVIEYDENSKENIERGKNLTFLEGAHKLDGFLEVYQEPIGRHHNSNILTYTKTWEKVRRIFANQPDSIEKGYKIGYFSFNSKGACPECRGAGIKRLWLGSLYVSNKCPRCKGKKFKNEILNVRYRGKNIVDILNMSISEALEFFKDDRTIFNMLSILERIGMGYLTLGQPTSSLSGGESQRVKIAKELGRNKKGHILYILDEPTSGLSLYDTAKLLSLLQDLVNNGNSIIVIEHDLDILSYCDWIVELGPEGGPKGGHIIAMGSPIDITNNKSSVIAPFLKILRK